VGKYGVDTPGFDVFLEKLDLFHPDVQLIVIDEIGKMELFSKRFRTLLLEALVLWNIVKNGENT
jgi:nucleoside-triphosphatase